MKLSGQQVKQLHDALLDAFDMDELKRLVRTGLDENLAAIAGGSNLSDVVFELIQWAERRGRVDELVRVALAERPDRAALRTLLADEGGTRRPESGAPAANRGAVMLDFDQTSISDSTINIAVHGEDGPAPDPLPLRAPTSGAVSAVKRELLQSRLALLLEQYRESFRQQDLTLDPTTRVKLAETARALEEEMTTVEQELAALEQSVDTEPAPVFAASRHYAELTDFEARKKQFIHPVENEIRDGRRTLTPAEQARCASSPWDFDRIMLYLYEENRAPAGVAQRMHRADQEFEKVRAATATPSLSPLYYAIRSLLRFLQRQATLPPVEPTVRSDLQRIHAYLLSRPELDGGNHVKENLVDLERILAAS